MKFEVGSSKFESGSYSRDFLKRFLRNARGFGNYPDFLAKTGESLVRSWLRSVPTLVERPFVFSCQVCVVLDEVHKTIFTKWLEEHSSSIVRVARAYTLTQDECQDLSQEILLQAWSSISKFEGKASPATWFYRIALHTALNWRRNDRPRRLRQQPWLTVQEPVVDPADVVRLTEKRELVARLYTAIHQLHKADVALVLLYLENMSYRDIAGVLGITESNVGVKLNRLQKKLADLMNSVPAEGERHES